MIVARSIEEVRNHVAVARGKGKRIGLVPTMGYLHEGHLSLVDLAKDNADFVVASIFVNPTQFGPNEDLTTYPRDEERDERALDDRGVDLLFAPDRTETIYPPGFSTRIEMDGVARPLEGERRPGHFSGVATVVMKLFNIVQPDVAVFGQKDAQQCAVVRRLVTDLHVPVEIIVGTTIREQDGLAMSSRNSYLRGDDRERAVLLSRALGTGHDRLLRGDSAAAAETAMAEVVDGATDVKIDYLRVVDPETFEPPPPFDQENSARQEPRPPLLVVGAIHVGRTRLIDNMKVEPQPRPTDSK